MTGFASGRGTGWQKIYFDVDYEITRNGRNIGIRWRIKWKINNKSWYGYNLVAHVWTEGNDYGRQIKGNSPNSGNGEALFPADGGWYWFDKGYSNNDITSCRIIINTTNGGTVSFDTGSDRTLQAPVGVQASSIANDVSFDIGNKLPLQISDITNLNYNYIVYLDVENEKGDWQNIDSINTTSKNFIWDISKLSNTLYNLLPTRNSAKMRISLHTYYNSTELGYNRKEGVCYVRNSNPIPFPSNSFKVTKWDSETEINTITAGMSAYNPNSNILVKINSISSIPVKNGATIKKIIVRAGTYVKEYNISLIIGKSLTVSYTDPFMLEDNELTNGKSQVELTIIDSRGNTAKTIKEITVYYLKFPKITSIEFKRDNGIESKTKIILKGNLGTPDLYNYVNFRYWIGNTEYEISNLTIDKNNNICYYTGYIYGDLGANGFSTNIESTVKYRLFTNIDYYNDEKAEITKVGVGVPFLYFDKNGRLGIGKKPNAKLDVGGTVNSTNITTTNLIIDGKNLLNRTYPVRSYISINCINESKYIIRRNVGGFIR